MFLVDLLAPRIPIVDDVEDSIETRVLLRAKELVEQGWTQGTFRKEGEGKDLYCAWGALNQSSTEHLEDQLKALRSFGLANGIGDPGGGIAAWNDSAWRTKRSVLKAFDKAIAYSREHE